MSGLLSDVYEAIPESRVAVVAFRRPRLERPPAGTEDGRSPGRHRGLVPEVQH